MFACLCQRGQRSGSLNFGFARINKRELMKAFTRIEKRREESSFSVSTEMVV